MDWIQAFTIIGVLGGIMFFALQRIEKDMEKDIENSNRRMEADVKSIGNKLDGHAQRIDQLYRMFIDLLKEKK